MLDTADFADFAQYALERVSNFSVSSTLLLVTFGPLVAYVLATLTSRIHRTTRSPLRALKSPPVNQPFSFKSIFFGHLLQLRNYDYAIISERWIHDYGHVFRYRGILGENRLLTVDLKALSHVIQKSNDYRKLPETSYNLRKLVGPGVLVAEGDQHRLQRRIMNPSFGPTTTKQLVPLYIQKSIQLRDIWADDLRNSSLANKANAKLTNKPKTFDALSWLGRATLDIIGLAGFGYHFDALKNNQAKNDLSNMFLNTFDAEGSVVAMRIVQGIFPLLRLIPTARRREENNAQAAMTRIGWNLLQERKDIALGKIIAKKDQGDDDAFFDADGRDVLSALVKINMDSDLPDDKRMSDRDVVAQVPTTLVAGHETTATSTTWALFALATQPAIQQRLRTELQSVLTDFPSADELNELPFLDAVIRETLRVHAAVLFVNRVAMKDDTIPVSRPFEDKNGQVNSVIRVQKGDTITIPIITINLSEEIWGPDAKEFNPDRWASVPDAAKDIPGVWGNLLSFLGGARACIGYRFALFEMKALLFTLVRAFEFELAVPVEAIEKKSLTVTRPYVKGRAQMPLRLRLCKP